MINQIQDEIKQYKHSKQDMQIGLTESFQPIIKAQEDVKQTIDKKQDKLIEQHDKNQKTLSSDLENIAMLQYVYDKPEKTRKFPIDYKPKMLSSKPDEGFTTNELHLITDHGFSAPSEIWNR